MSTKWPQGEITPNIPASVLGGNNISGVYTLDQLNRLNADFGPQMQKSLRFRSSASAYLNRTPSVAGNRQTWTWSGWVKRGKLGLSTRQALFGSASGTSDSTWLEFGFDLSSSVADAFYVTTYNTVATSTAVYRDPSSWYHVVVSFDTTQATASNRLKVYINGSQISMSSSFTPTQNATYGVNAAQIHTIASESYGGTVSNFFDGYMAEVNFIDGQALTPSSFGKYNATTGGWQPIFYAGTYGTNGFRLTFANNASTTTLGYDTSGNGNNWTTNNISVTAGSTYDSMLDVPTNWVAGDPVQARGNYAVLNVVASDGTVSNANLTVAWSGGNSAKPATIGMSSGKWYCEIYIDTVGTAALPGIIPSTMIPSAGYPGSGSGGYGYYYDGQKYTAGAGSAYGASYTTGNIISIAFDADAGSLTFYKNGVSQGVAFSSIPAGAWFFAAGHSGSCTMSPNFGQRPFAYTPPTGFKSLCTQNLPAPTIYNGANHMAATTYTGTGATQSISNAVNSVSFQPDFVWLKSRSNAYSHKLYDSIRGVYKELSSDSTAAESTDTNQLTAFNSNGWSVGSGLGSNGSGSTFVGWQWKAGGTAVTNTSGTITSSVSANTTAGFSVVTATLNSSGIITSTGHGLGVAPAMIIMRDRTNTDGWYVYHQSSYSTPTQATLLLNTTSAINTAGGSSGGVTKWTVSATTFGAGNSAWTYTPNGQCVFYCFAAIAGYSAFGSYTGNGSADGPFVYCGFRPRFILIKGSSFVSNWFIEDASRNGYNVNSGVALRPNLSNAEDGTTTYDLDILSNGFKLRSSSGDSNSSGATFIYAAFCESPFQNSLAR